MKKFYAAVTEKEELGGLSYAYEISGGKNLAKIDMDRFVVFQLCETKKQALETTKMWNHISRVNHYEKTAGKIATQAFCRVDFLNPIKFVLYVDKAGDMEYAVYDNKSIFRTFPKNNSGYESAARTYNSLVPDEEVIPLF